MAHMLIKRRLRANNEEKLWRISVRLIVPSKNPNAISHGHKQVTFSIDCQRFRIVHAAGNHLLEFSIFIENHQPIVLRISNEQMTSVGQGSYTTRTRQR